jgi:hypothetical protein
MDSGFGIETFRFFSLFTYFDRKNPFFTITCPCGMRKKSRTPPNTALLDVDWLSGKRADPRLRLPTSAKNPSMLGTALRVTVLFVVVASAVGLWSPLSQRWLRDHGIALLDNGKSSADETLAMLVSLNALDQPNSTPPQNSATVTSELPVSSDAVSSDAVSSDAVSSGVVSSGVVSSGVVSSGVVSSGVVSSPPVVTPYVTAARISDDNSVPPPPMINRSTLAVAGNRPNVAKASLSDQPDSKPLPPVDNNAIVARSAEFKRTQSKPPIVVPVEQPNAVLAANAEQSPHDELRQLPIERLFPLLGSTQERRVRLVCDELSQRGVPNSLLDLAVQLARGDEALQLELLESLTRVDDANPAPLLCWMAQSSSKAVRKRAIAILGSLQDREVVQQLRFLASREPDSSLRQLIEQTVASNSGTVK